jgi:hypothetical protein
MYTVAALVVLIIVSISGCTDKPEEVQDEVNIYVYEQTGEEGDPQEQIREFYDMVDEQSGPPVLVPLRKHAVEFDLDTETGEISIDTMKIYDSDGNPVDYEKALAMQDRIVKDDAGNIITDKALLDLHIKPIGKNKYEISGIAPYLEHDGYKYKVDYCYNSKVNDKPNRLTDAKIDTDNGKGEITAGFFVAENEEGVEQVYALFIADEEAKRQEISIKNGWRENSKYINSFAEIHDFPGISSYVINMSDINECAEGVNGAGITSPGMMSELLDRKDDDRVHFSIAKEKL